MNLKLNERVEEIAQHIPKRIRAIVLNAILAKSAENGDLIKELGYYLSTEELEEIAEKLHVSISIKPKKNISSKASEIMKKSKRKSANVKMKPKDEKEEMDIFIGFDD